MYKVIDNRSSWDAKLNIQNFSDALNEIIFWKDNFITLNCRKRVLINTTFVSLFTDASDSAVGAVLQNRFVAHKNFYSFEQIKSSTWRELSAILYALESFKEQLFRQNVIVHTDNMAASIIIKSGSRKKELQDLAIEIFNLCTRCNIHLTVTWIPRENNQFADLVSKHIDKDDWETSKTLFDFLSLRWGPFTVDRFADNDNKKVNSFNSKFFCPETKAVDAFSQTWTHDNNYLVPPVSEIIRVIKKIQMDRARGVLVVPLWKSSDFWPMLLKNSEFDYFIKDYITFDNANNEWLQSGKYKFDLIGSPSFKGKIIAFSVQG